MATTTAPAPAAAPAAKDTAAGRGPATWHALLIAAAFATAYAALALASTVPMMRPDEITYAALARSTAAGHGLLWLGGHVDLRAALYVYVISPAWALFSDTAAYDAAKVESAVLACTLAVPIWLVARRLLPGWAPLLAVALALAGTWMDTTAHVATENLALPLATASIGALLLALLRPGGRAGWAALGLALLASWARLELVALLPGMLLAFAADAVRHGSGWRERLALHRPMLLALLGIGVAGLLLAAVDGRVVAGSYSVVFQYRPSVGAALGKIGRQLLEIAALTGYVPLLLGAACATRRRSWRDDAVGPLLAVLVPMTFVFALESGVFLSAYGSGVVWGLQRYAEYPAPWWLLFVLVLGRRPYLVDRVALAVGLALSALLLLAPKTNPLGAGEELALLSTLRRAGPLVPGGAAGPTVLAACLVVLAGLAGAIALARWRSWRLPTAIGVVLLAVLVTQSVTAWSWKLHLTSSERSQLPPDLEWVDHHSQGPVGLFAVIVNSPKLETLEMFNKNITRAYVPAWNHQIGGWPINSRQCHWSAAASGLVSFEPGCGPAPHTFLLQDPQAYVGFQNPVAVQRNASIGALAAVSGAPRLRAVVEVPCDRTLAVPTDGAYACGDGIVAHFWLTRPGTLLLHLRGGEINGTIGFRGHTYTVPPLQDSVIRLPLPAGSTHQELQFNWKELSQAAPEILGVAVAHDGGRVQRLI